MVKLTNRCSSQRRCRIPDRVQSGRSADLMDDSAPLLNSMLAFIWLTNAIAASGGEVGDIIFKGEDGV